MQFVYPAFLFGLLSLAIPIIIHLFHFRRYKKVYFSNVQFLKNIQQQQSSRKNLKKLIILLTRMLALFFLVFAFARPYVPAGNVTYEKAHVVSVFIDNSYSMEAINREGTLLDEARRRAKEIVSSYGINDRFHLLTQDFEGAHQRVLSREEFNDEVDKIKISPQSRTLQQIIDRQQSMFNMPAEKGKMIYVLSDFQKNMFTQHTIKAEQGVSINLVKLKSTSLPNIAVDSAWLLSAVHRPGDAEKLVVLLHNYADEKAEKVPLKLLINGVQKAFGGFTLNARAIQNDTLSFSGLQAGWQHAEIQLQDNPVGFDNQFYLAFKVQQQMPILLIDGGVPNKYIQAVFNTDPFFKVQTVSDGNIDYASLPSYPVIILSDVRSITTGLVQQLKSYVNNGGVLLVFPADAADLASYRSFLQPLGAAYPQSLITEKTKVVEINMQSQVFKTIFEQVPQNIDLPTVDRYYKLSQDLSMRSENLLELADKKPFMGMYRHGNGKVYVAAVPLDLSYSNLPHHALLVPLLLKMALLSGRYQPLFYTIGQEEIVETSPFRSSDKQILKIHKGQQTFIPDVRQREGSSILYLADQVHEAGNYELKKQDSLIAVFAFNNNRSESDLTYLDNTALKAQMGDITGSVLQTNGTSLKDSIVKTNMGLELWKLCIILTLICLAAEILLIRFYKPDKQVVLAQV